MFGKVLSLLPAKLLGVGILLAGVFLFFALTSTRIALRGGEEVTVPDVVGKSVADAWEELSELGLELKKAHKRYDALPENHIISQDPLPGSIVKQGRPIEVVISLGSELVRAPRLLGNSLRQARVIIKKSQLTVGHLSWIHHPSEKNLIAAQWPLPGDPISREAPVDLLVSLGPRPKVYSLPNLIGLNVQEVTKLLKQLGLAVGRVEEELDQDKPEGTVLDHDPSAGTGIQEGEEVALKISYAITTEYDVVSYLVPMGFSSRELRIEVSDEEGTREVFREVVSPGDKLSVPVGHIGDATVRIYENDVLVEVREY